MTHSSLGEIRPNSDHIARAQTLAHQLFPLATYDDAAVSLPLFRLVNVLADAMDEAAQLSLIRRHSPCIRLRAANLADLAFPAVEHDQERVDLPLSRLIDLLAKAMVADDVSHLSTAPAFLPIGIDSEGGSHD